MAPIEKTISKMMEINESLKHLYQQYGLDYDKEFYAVFPVYFKMKKVPKSRLDIQFLFNMISKNMDLGYQYIYDAGFDDENTETEFYDRMNSLRFKLIKLVR
jgi:hypothetical protein